MVLLTNNREVALDNNQFFQFTPSGKRLKLWEGDPDNKNAKGCQRICYWLKKSVIAFYQLEKVN